MNIEMITTQYYANWLGVEPNQMKDEGLFFIFSSERDITQKGYIQQFDLYAWVTDKLVIISYGSKLKDKIERIIDKIKPDMKTEQITSLLALEYCVTPARNIKFVFNGQKTNGEKAQMLTTAEYPMYYNFFIANNPNCKNTDWLKEYFNEMVARELCYGIIVDDKLVCANDLPDMPYMDGYVQEIGINTLVDFKGKGFAKDVCLTCISKMTAKNICPQWSTAYGNIASEKLAYSLGFQKFSETITISF